MEQIFYYGDAHLGHENVIKHDNRPFNNIYEMDRTLIDLYNSRVTNKDKVIIVGDFIYKSKREPEWYLRQLKGKKYLVIGNHDGAILKNDKALSYFEEVDKMMHVIDGKNHICVCHFPIAEWNGQYKGHYHVYAHIHNNINKTYEYMKTFDKALNAGCMINNYMPVTFNELIENNNRFKSLH